MAISFRLDRTAFHAGTHQQAEQYHARCQALTFAERLQRAMYLNSIAYGFDPNDPPRLDRTAFWVRKHG